MRKLILAACVLAAPSIGVAHAAGTAHLTPQRRAIGCTWDKEEGLFCNNPGTGMCWRKGHNPYVNPHATLEGIDIGNDPASPDYGHEDHGG